MQAGIDAHKAADLKGLRSDARHERSNDANTITKLEGDLPKDIPDQLDKEKKMQVETKCFATLADKETCDYRNSTSYDLAEGQTVGHLADMAGVTRADIKTIFVNGRHADLDTMLSHGDRVGFVPAVGGM